MPKNVHFVKAMAFPVVIYGCESWTINKAKHWITFEPWYWRRLLRVPWTSRSSNQSILREISPEYLLERLMLKLKLQYFGHLIRRTNSLKKTLILGKIECRRGWHRMDGWMATLTWWAWVKAISGRSWYTGSPDLLQSCGHKESDMTQWLNWFAMKWWECLPRSSFFDCCILRQLFHSPLHPNQETL